MLHSTLREVTAIHKIKADSLQEEKQKYHGLWATQDSLHKYLVNSDKWALVLGFQLSLKGLV